jgi:hypothetical protein
MKDLKATATPLNIVLTVLNGVCQFPKAILRPIIRKNISLFFSEEGCGPG